MKARSYLGWVIEEIFADGGWIYASCCGELIVTIDIDALPNFSSNYLLIISIADISSSLKVMASFSAAVIPINSFLLYYNYISLFSASFEQIWINYLSTKQKSEPLINKSVI